MRFLTVLWLIASVLPFVCTQTLPDYDSFSPPFSSPPSLHVRRERTPDVRFDNYTFIVRDQRIFLHSGEFHTFRLPVASLWPDIIQKAKAAGLNGLSVYTHMGLLNPAPGIIDLDGFRALEPLFKSAKEEGLWIVLRPGPYINAETTAGGLAHWATTEVPGRVRTNDTTWKAAWQDYISAIIEEAAPWQINQGGPIIAVQIDNEFSQSVPEQAGYFVDLQDAYHASDIAVPLTYNDPGPRRNFINGTGAVDLYGMDAYPQSFDCANPTFWKPAPTDLRSYHMDVNPHQVWWSPEFQGGAHNPWGPKAPTWDDCRTMTGPDFQNVFNKHFWASNMKAMNYYMFYGGTNWGGLAFPGAHTSYDYGASVQENRMLSAKYTQLKIQAMFIRSSPEFYKTEWIGDSVTSLPNATNNAAAYATLMENPDTSAGFWITRQTDATSRENITFKLALPSGLQIPLSIPAIQLWGRESKIIVTNYTFGKSGKVRHSTAEVFFSGTIDGRDVLFIHGRKGQDHELAFVPAGRPNFFRQSSPIKLDTLNNSATLVTILPGAEGLITVWDSDKQLVLYADTETAGTFWAPVIPSADANDPFRSFWQYGTNTSVLVAGPYLVRKASITDRGRTLELTGDLNAADPPAVTLSIIAPKSVIQAKWNGKLVPFAPTASPSSPSVRYAQIGIRKEALSVKVPSLTGWKYHDSLPEIQPGYDDSKWVDANKKTSNMPWVPYYGDGTYLYACDYGFCENNVLWRGHFESTGMEKSVNLSIYGSSAFAATVWLNDAFMGTTFGNSSGNRNIIDETDTKFIFPEGALKSGEDNVITVLQDNMGHLFSYPVLDSAKTPIGIRGAQLNDGKFSHWKVQGKVGGYKNYPDKTRGVLNEGGFLGERKGWHLPGFNTSSWMRRDLSQGLPTPVGVGFFVTTFKLDIPKNLDVMMSFTFEEPFGQPYRAYLYVNGWNMGKRVGNLGPQEKFPIHEGILNHQGENTVAVALWSMLPNETIAPKLQLRLDSVLEGGIGAVAKTNPGWSPNGRE